MKYETYGEYDPQAVAQTLPAFLTVWSGLGTYHDDLVLVGGLVPHFICAHPTNPDALPRPATLDVDLGIALGASAGQYGSLASDLRAQGFNPSDKYPGRFEKNVDGFPLYVDFLVEHGSQSSGTRMVDDIPANVMPGVVRALETARIMTVEGKDLFGAEQKLSARICEVGAFLVLKLRAFLRRQQGKDAFDLLYTMMHFDGGTSTAVEAFTAEAKAANPAFADARTALATLFADEDSPGPAKAAHFVFGEEQTDDSEDTRTRRLQVQQDAVSAALLLTKALA